MIDDLDRKLIAELARDARLKSTDLAKKLGVSDTTIRHRISRLEKERVISPTIFVDAGKLGYTLIALIALQVDLGRIDVIAAELSRQSNVGYVAECTGQHDMFVGVWLHSPNELTHFVKDFLSKLPGIRKSETYMILNVHKNDIGWLQTLK
jgi:Lrp/AsnC family transcriptional regulator, regulator for asnA, asnC and gidA